MNRTTYPTHLQFASTAQEQFAIQLLPFSRAFFEGGILNESEVTSWENVFFHCLTVAQAAHGLATRISQLGDPKTLAVAAFLHDAYKRKEVDAIQKTPESVNILYKTDTDSEVWLRNIGYLDADLVLMNAFGNNAALSIFKGEMSDLPRRTLHYLDDITMGDQIVTLEERLSSLEQNPRYAEQNEWSRSLFDGMTLYEAKRIINKKTEGELSDLLGLKSDEILPIWIRGQVGKIR